MPTNLNREEEPESKAEQISPVTNKDGNGPSGEKTGADESMRATEQSSGYGEYQQMEAQIQEEDEKVKEHNTMEQRFSDQGANNGQVSDQREKQKSEDNPKEGDRDIRELDTRQLGDQDSNQDMREQHIVDQDTDSNEGGQGTRESGTTEQGGQGTKVQDNPQQKNQVTQEQDSHHQEDWDTQEQDKQKDQDTGKQDDHQQVDQSTEERDSHQQKDRDTGEQDGQNDLKQQEGSDERMEDEAHKEDADSKECVAKMPGDCEKPPPFLAEEDEPEYRMSCLCNNTNSSFDFVHLIMQGSILKV